jgi:hypothetical protein
MYYRAGRESAINGAALKLLARDKYLNPLLCGIAAGANLAFSAILRRYYMGDLSSSWLLVVLSLVSLAFMLTIFIWGEVNWGRVIQFSREGAARDPAPPPAEELSTDPSVAVAEAPNTGLKRTDTALTRGPAA